MVVVEVEVVGKSWLTVRDHFPFPAVGAIVVAVVGRGGGAMAKVELSVQVHILFPVWEEVVVVGYKACPA